MANKVNDQGIRTPSSKGVRGRRGGAANVEDRVVEEAQEACGRRGTGEDHAVGTMESVYYEQATERDRKEGEKGKKKESVARERGARRERKEDEDKSKNMELRGWNIRLYDESIGADERMRERTKWSEEILPGGGKSLALRNRRIWGPFEAYHRFWGQIAPGKKHRRRRWWWEKRDAWSHNVTVTLDNNVKQVQVPASARTSATTAFNLS
ncbi:hypothetical protein R3P38DRAFT_2775674 [Favolaschia claudopus]|uniref:Uncharacterized protein n=1 Tax=Favolaschia claudopus TaxID=2862362 RepID=A0AAW0BS58_9AGAR